LLEASSRRGLGSSAGFVPVSHVVKSSHKSSEGLAFIYIHSDVEIMRLQHGALKKKQKRGVATKAMQ
jgi:hypothetical protein